MGRYCEKSLKPIYKLAKLASLFSVGLLSFSAHSDDVALNSLLDLDIAELSEVVITSSKKEELKHQTSAIVSTLTKEDIRKYSVNNLAELLELLPSTMALSSFFIPHGQIGIRSDISSHYNKHTLLLVNGRPLRDSLFSGLDTAILAGFPIASIGRIEFVRGPGSVLYDSRAYTGVINIILEKNAVHELAVEAGSYDTASLQYTVQNRNDDNQYGFALYSNYTGGWTFNAEDIVGQRNQFAVRKKTLGAQFNYSQKVLDFVTVYNYTDIPYLGRGNNWRNQTSLKTWRLFSDIGFKKQWDKKLNSTLNFTVNYSGFEDEPQNNKNRASSLDYQFELTNFYKINEHYDVILGGLVQRITGDWNNELTNVVPDYSEDWYSSYFQIKGKLSDKFQVLLGVQQNKVPDLDSEYVPRLSAIYNIDNKQGVRSSYGGAFRSASSQEKFVNLPGRNLGNEFLEPEKIATSDIQYFYHTPGMEYALTYFYSKEKNLIGRRKINDGPSDATQIQMNLGGMRTRGLEFELKWQQNVWSSLFSASAFKNEDDAGIENARFTPEFMSKLGVNYQLNEKEEISILGKYFDKGRPINSDMPNNAVDDILLASLSYRYRFLSSPLIAKHGAELELSVDNLLDESVNYPEVVFKRTNSIPGRGGRSFFVKLRLDL